MRARCGISLFSLACAAISAPIRGITGTLEADAEFPLKFKA
jgi:hypothetical protein